MQTYKKSKEFLETNSMSKKFFYFLGTYKKVLKTRKSIGDLFWKPVTDFKNPHSVLIFRDSVCTVMGLFRKDELNLRKIHCLGRRKHTFGENLGNFYDCS